MDPSVAFERLKRALSPGLDSREIDKRRDSLIVFGFDGKSGVPARVGRPPRGKDGQFVVEGDTTLGSALDASLRADELSEEWSTSPASDGRSRWRIGESEFLELVGSGDFATAMRIEPKQPLSPATKHVMLGESVGALAEAAKRSSLKETVPGFRRSLRGNRSSRSRSGMLNGKFQVFADRKSFVPTAREFRRIGRRGASCGGPATEEQS